MKKSYKIVWFIFSFFIIFPIFSSLGGPFSYALAVDGNAVEYRIYNEKGDLVSTKSHVEEGDTFITSDFYEYEIYKIEDDKGFARKLRQISPPKISKGEIPRRWGLNRKTIGLYMTHNDESYTLSDGYDSIYGAGGIHDVAKTLGQEFADRGINVVLDETLHIPHDNSAYSRSAVTAKRLMQNDNPDALFDIHRDGVSKKYYHAVLEDGEFSKIRIVVGKSNPNYEESLAFAQKVFALGNRMYPWLFLDIYCGKGHYNQSLQSTNLLFEMGTYLIEKELVLNSIPYLADVVETALYDSVSNGDGEIIVDELKPEIEIEGNEFEDAVQTNKKKSGAYWLVVIVSVACVGGLAWYIIRKSFVKNKKP